MRLQCHHYKWLTAFACLLGIPLWASAQKQDTVATKNLQEVAVTALRVGKEVIPGQKLQGKDLQRLGAHSVGDALRFFSGVQIKDYGGIGGLKTIDVRSMGTNQTGVFYDGIQLGNAQNGQVDLGKFSLDNMQAIELYNGQKSSIFQPAKDYASASSLYLTTLFKNDEKTHLKGSIKTGSFGLFNPSLLWQQKINNKIAATFSTEWVNATGDYKFRYTKKDSLGHTAYDTTARRKNGDVNVYRVEGGVYGTIKNGEWSTKLYYYNSERGIPGFVVNGVFGHVDRQWDSNFFVQSSFRKDIGPKYSLLLNGKYGYDYTRFLAPDTTAVMIDNHFRQYEAYFSAANQYILTSWWNIGLSGDFQYNRLDDLYNFTFPVRFTTLVAAASSVSLQRFNAQASLLTTIVNESVKRSTAAPHKREFTPAVFASWQPFKTPDLRLKAYYKRIFRMPTFNDLYYTYIGSSNLKPEFANQYDLGATFTKTIDGLIKEAGIDADIYYNTVTDKIVAVPGSNPSRWMMMNLGFVQVKGLNLKAKANWQLKELQISTRLTYTFERSQDFTDRSDSFYGDQIAYIPRHSGSFIMVKKTALRIM